MTNYKQTAAFTVFMCPKHMRAGETKERPVGILHTDAFLNEKVPANLALTIEEARDLAQSLLAMIEAVEAA